VTLVISLTLFVLAVFLGVELISKVPPTLHTPLMSGSNAISGITLIGALVSAGADHRALTTWLGFAAVALATINVVGGFVVTNRMLAMFKTRKPKPSGNAASSGESATSGGPATSGESAV